MRSLYFLFVVSLFTSLTFADAKDSAPSPTSTPAAESVSHKTTSQQIHAIDKEIQARKLQVFHYKKSNDPMSRLQIQNLEEEIAALEEQKSGFKKLLKN